MHAAHIHGHHRASLAAVYDVRQNVSLALAAELNVPAANSAEDIFANPWHVSCYGDTDIADLAKHGASLLGGLLKR